MILSKYNIYTEKSYRYDMDDHDYFAPMFDENLHKNDIIPDFYPNNKICAYCNTEFQYRNQLFKHLGYHGLDIRKNELQIEMDIVCEGEPFSDNSLDKRNSNVRCVKRRLKKKKVKIMSKANITELVNQLRL